MGCRQRDTGGCLFMDSLTRSITIGRTFMRCRKISVLVSQCHGGTDKVVIVSTMGCQCTWRSIAIRRMAERSRTQRMARVELWFV